IADDKESGGNESASSPIVPPQPLFDTRPMETDDETDEPISGGGNSALIGTGVNSVTGDEPCTPVQGQTCSPTQGEK
ncbi:MAG: hypothetical protein ABIR51_06480, partial [Sphingomicrobium sp.]